MAGVNELINLAQYTTQGKAQQYRPEQAISGLLSKAMQQAYGGGEQQDLDRALKMIELQQKQAEYEREQEIYKQGMAAAQEQSARENNLAKPDTAKVNSNAGRMNDTFESENYKTFELGKTPSVKIEPKERYESKKYGNLADFIVDDAGIPRLATPAEIADENIPKVKLPATTGTITAAGTIEAKKAATTQKQAELSANISKYGIQAYTKTRADVIKSMFYGIEPKESDKVALLEKTVSERLAASGQKVSGKQMELETTAADYRDNITAATEAISKINKMQIDDKSKAAKRNLVRKKLLEAYPNYKGEIDKKLGQIELKAGGFLWGAIGSENVE